MAEQFGERTEAPTQKRRKDARERGELLKSRDFATALVVLAGVAWVALFGSSLLKACKAVMAAAFRFDRGDVEDFQPWRPLVEAGWQLAPALGSLFAITVAAGILSQASLGSLGFNGGLLAPKASRINPASGLKRIFGPTGWIELGKSLLKVVLLGSVGAWLLMSSSRAMFGLASSDVETAVGTLGGTLTHILIVMALGLVAIAMVDVPVQIVQLLGKLRMTKQEVKDEHKESEGNPELKGHIRAKQRAILSRSMKKALAEAHVVLTNPTHFAVALRYDRGQDQVPVVVAKGRGATALAIRETATDYAVPVLEYPQLARAVYYTSREGQEIRDDLYLAIATVLAFVFNLNAAMGGRAPPAIEVPPTARFDENGVKQG
ncbi:MULTISPECIES: flagellar biosynthesis protein FlhB [unclassified Sphingomonas]|uniref:EscU/YscU/HrcU family type III secretion system export apparatus switch protein n=1 Tax=unclassified Sphingomonas TaxID=196159 RepID=UPI0009262957|nr:MULTISPECIES: flagellar type III secretion system protein FlhB [unclassified Sphingomonas]MBN8847859.1 flagellar biosynthesis protein FlhB [Sphingomonas sp.]OJV33466.1 MAG: flagellar biosynthesis protein FlhB [Sphingomonas sp. 67-36]